MSTVIAYCGLACDSCPIHLATLEQDAEKKQRMRIEIARICRERYDMKLRPEDVTDCDGCRAETGRLFSSCAACEIRKCAREKNLESCAYCSNYACERLEKLFVDDADARTRLEILRSVAFDDHKEARRMEIRIEKLESMRVASFYAFGNNPEKEAWNDLVLWAEPQGLLQNLQERFLFGYNSPSSTRAGERYGYEIIMKVGLDAEPDTTYRITDFMGGTYAVLRCEVKGKPWETVPRGWQELAAWCKNNNYEFGYHRELERYLTRAEDLNALVLDLYYPIKVS